MNVCAEARAGVPGGGASVGRVLRAAARCHLCLYDSLFISLPIFLYFLDELAFQWTQTNDIISAHPKKEIPLDPNVQPVTYPVIRHQ
jgi:hypothetical protein